MEEQLQNNARIKKNKIHILPETWPKGGGEMGKRIRSNDWGSTSLGTTNIWPQSLKTAIGIILTTRQPAYIAWGPDYISFYNDAYIGLIAEKHPAMLGARAQDIWAEAWDVAKREFDHVMEGGDPTWNENQLVPIFRNGEMQNVYWTFGCAPIYDLQAPNGIGGCLVLCTETTPMVLSLKESEIRYQKLFEAMEDGFAICELIRDEKNAAIDFQWITCNPAMERLTSLKLADVIGKSASQIIPGEYKRWLNIYTEVVDKMQVKRFESGIEARGRMWDLTAFPYNGDQFAVLYDDITPRKKAEQQLKDFNSDLEELVVERTNELKESKELLRSIIDAPNVGLAVYHTIRDEEGNIVDFIHEFVNERTKMALQKDVTGWRLTDHGKDGAEQLRSFIEVMKTGKQNSYTRQVVIGGREVHILFSNARIDEERMVHIWEDVTELKNAEKEIQKSKDMLQSIFDSSLHMLTVLRAVRNEKNELVDFKVELVNERMKQFEGEDIAGKNFLEVHPGIRKTEVIHKFMKVIESGNREDFELYYNHEGIDGWFRVVTIKLGDGLIISCENITARKNTEKEVIELKLIQQKEILNAIIMTQEQERERIGEALHNGVAQLLYGIQLRSELLKPTDQATKKVVQEIRSIVAEAIHDTRGISFELVPGVLKDHGVKVALKSLIQKVVTDKIQIQFNYNIKQKLSDKIEFPIYRIMQELLNNILKHAHATKAEMEISCIQNVISISVQDNGCGFNEKEIRGMHKGIGLQSIENRVKLLQGTLKIKSDSGKGTNILINIPL